MLFSKEVENIKKESIRAILKLKYVIFIAAIEGLMLECRIWRNKNMLLEYVLLDT